MLDTDPAETGRCNAPVQKNRFRLPHIERPGRAQLTLLETALWPLDLKSSQGSIYKTSFQFSEEDTKQRQLATVQVRAPLGIHAEDEYLLWGLLSLTLERGDDSLLLTTPYWCLKQLGLPTGGSYYARFRSALDRLASASYHCDNFFNPIVGKHQFVTFGFFSIYLPVDVHSPESWGIQWDPVFYKMCRSKGGNLLFDLERYKQLSPAERRLLLMLHDRFYRSNRVFMNVDDLTIRGLGFAAHRPLKKRKHDLLNAMRTLATHGIIEPGRGQVDVSECFLKRSKGVYVATFYPGAYFKQGATNAPRKPRLVTDDPLYEPLKAIGFDGNAADRILRQFSRRLIQEKIKTTEIAMHHTPKGFTGFRRSAAAFCYDQLKHRHPKPDWQHEWERTDRHRQWQEQSEQSDSAEQALRERYEQARQEALAQYIATDGRSRYEKAFAGFLQMYEAKSDLNARQRAKEHALEHLCYTDAFEFPTYPVWALKQHVAAD